MKKSVANGPLTNMEGCVASKNPPARLNQGEINLANENWNESLSLLASEEAKIMIRPILSRFSGSMKATLGHLTTVHNETCGCQTGSTLTHEAINRVWNQKKVLFMELQKQSGLEEFEDFLNRVLRLLLTSNSIRDIPPLSESDFWMLLRSENNKDLIPCTADSMEEDLADINNLIAKG